MTTESRVKICAVKDCKNKAMNYLRLVYTSRWGWFCNSCRQSLSEEGLVCSGDTLMTMTDHYAGSTCKVN